MMKCLSCGHIAPETELNCPECGSFYTVIMSNHSAEKQSKSKSVADTIKNENVLSYDKNDDE
jgi:predicted RNA-binding Zn-ribbon protein involved in translation (DUF1610 family)